MKELRHVSCKTREHIFNIIFWKYSTLGNKKYSKVYDKKDTRTVSVNVIRVFSFKHGSKVFDGVCLY